MSENRELSEQLTDLAVRRVAHLERCWTRFDDSSDLAALNRANGNIVRVDPSTIDLLRAMVLAYRMTSGSCDPAYRTTSPGSDALGSVRIDEIRQFVQMPAGLELDPGSIGKGLAADLVAHQLLASGATGALVEIGGDLRTVGAGPHHGLWPVAIEDPFGDGHRQQLVHVRDAGMSTSGSAVASEGAGPDNVSVEPVTGQPLCVTPGSVVSATVIAGTALEAEMWSTALLVSNETDLEPLARRGCLARVTLGSGAMRATDMWNSTAVNVTRLGGADDV